jgi:glucose-1-phosphate adenylyltransferase
LLEKLNQGADDDTSAYDFGRDIIPAMVRDHAVYAYDFNDYWVDVGTIATYWQTNLDLLLEHPALELYDHRWTIHTRSEERPPVKMVEGAQVEGSLLSNGCIVAGTVVNSVLSPGVIVEAGAEVRDSVIMNDTVVQAGARVDRCILDKQIVVGRDALVGHGTEHSPNRHEPENLNSGITIAGKGARIPDGTRIGRNCAIGAGARESHFPGKEIASGESVLVEGS